MSSRIVTIVRVFDYDENSTRNFACYGTSEAAQECAKALNLTFRANNDPKVAYCDCQIML